MDCTISCNAPPLCELQKDCLTSSSCISPIHVFTSVCTAEKIPRGDGTLKLPRIRPRRVFPRTGPWRRDWGGVVSWVTGLETSRPQKGIRARHLRFPPGRPGSLGPLRPIGGPFGNRDPWVRASPGARLASCRPLVPSPASLPRAVICSHSGYTGLVRRSGCLGYWLVCPGVGL